MLKTFLFIFVLRKLNKQEYNKYDFSPILTQALFQCMYHLHPETIYCHKRAEANTLQRLLRRGGEPLVLPLYQQWQEVCS